MVNRMFVFAVLVASLMPRTGLAEGQSTPSLSASAEVISPNRDKAVEIAKASLRQLDQNSECTDKKFKVSDDKIEWGVDFEKIIPARPNTCAIGVNKTSGSSRWIPLK